MIYNNVSVKQVIAKVFTDYDLHEESHRIADYIEWAGEALEKIGAFPQLEIKVTGKGGVPLLKIENYQVSLPVGLYGIIQAVYTAKEGQGASYQPMQYGTGSFDAVKGVTVHNTVDNTYSTRDETCGETSKASGITYVVAGGYLKTNVRDGYIMLSYTSIPLDEEGYPKVPDNMSFLDALYWYIVMKSLYPKWVNGTIRDMVYFEARRSWNYYRKQAYGEALMPQGDQLESVKNIWNQLMPELGSGKDFYSSIGGEQAIYNQTNCNAKHYPVLC